MKKIISQKSLHHKITALFLSICLFIAFAPSVFAAESPSDLVSTSDQTPVTTETAAATTTTEAALTTQATEATQAAQSTYTKTANAGFENVESDGGTLFVGTARIPKADGSFATVKFIYSSGINLNDKSLSLINTELNALGVTVSGSMVYVSRSDLVSDSTLVTETSERQAVFACGSEAAPTVLTAYPAYETVEMSFEYLYRGYVYSVSDYNSLSSVLGGRSEVTLSEDGKSAYTSIVMEEDYVEKVINGKTVKILMINSELKYCFRAPRLVYVKDDTYNVASASDITYYYPTTSADTSSTTPTDIESSLTTLSTDGESTTTTSPDELIVSSDEESTDAAVTTTTEAAVPTDLSTETQSTTDTTDTTTINIWDYLTTAAETKITAGASPIVTSATTQITTVQTTAAPTTAYTISAEGEATAPTAVTTSAALTTTTASTTSNIGNSTTSSPTLPTPTTTTQNNNSAILPNVNSNESLSSNRGIVATRRLPLNIRSGPGTNYMIVTVLPKGTYVTVLDTSNPDWYMVKTMGKVVGYAYSGYIRIM